MCAQGLTHKCRQACTHTPYCIQYAKDYIQRRHVNFLSKYFFLFACCPSSHLIYSLQKESHLRWLLAKGKFYSWRVTWNCTSSWISKQRHNSFSWFIRQDLDNSSVLSSQLVFTRHYEMRIHYDSLKLEMNTSMKYGLANMMQPMKKAK